MPFNLLDPAARGAGFALLAFVLFSPDLARAGVLEGVAGWEGDSRQQGYGYLGLGAQLPARGELTVPFSLSVSYLYYHYDDAGTRISVRSPGASVMSGVRFHAARFSGTVLAGAEIRWEHQETNSLNSLVRRRATTGPVFQFYGEQALASRWQASEFGIYVGSANYIVSRASLRYQLTNVNWKGRTTFFMGIEGVRQGNEFSDAAQVGGFAEWNLLPLRMSLGLHSGYKESWSPGQTHERGQYLGSSLYRRF
jgi:hypothetical protein